MVLNAFETSLNSTVYLLVKNIFTDVSLSFLSEEIKQGFFQGKKLCLGVKIQKGHDSTWGMRATAYREGYRSWFILMFLTEL